MLFKKPAEFSLAQFLAQQGRFDEARESFDEAYRIQVSAYGKHHFYPALTLLEIGRMYQKQQDQYQACVQHMQEALMILEDVLPLDHVDVVTAFESLVQAMVRAA